MAWVLIFAASALLCLGLGVESLECKDCLLEMDPGGCFVTAGTCKAAETCMTITVEAEEDMKFRIYGCFMPDHYPCGMRKKTGSHVLNVRCCTAGDRCNEKLH